MLRISKQLLKNVNNTDDTQKKLKKHIYKNVLIKILKDVEHDTKKT